jgi:hypothetical protein
MADIYVNGTTDLAIRAAAEALQPGDRLIFLNGFDYQTAWPIYLPDHCQVIGNGAWITYSGNGSAIELKNKSTKSAWKVTIENLNLRTSTGAVGFDFHGPRYCRLSGCTVIGFSEAGYKLDGGGKYNNDQYYYGAWYNVLERCAAYYCQTGLVLAGQHQDGQANANLIQRCTFMGETDDRLEVGGSWSKFTNSIGVDIVEGNANAFTGCDVSRNDTGFRVADKEFTAIGSYIEYATTGFELLSDADRATIIGSRFIQVVVPIGGAKAGSATVMP